MKKKTIHVVTGEGIESFPLSAGIAIGEAGIKVLTPETDPVEVVRDSFIRRRLRAGDLAEVKDVAAAKRNAEARRARRAAEEAISTSPAVVTFDAAESDTPPQGTRARMPLPPKKEG